MTFLGIPVFVNPDVPAVRFVLVDSSFHDAMLDHWMPHLSASRDGFGPLAPKNGIGTRSL